MMAAVFFFIFVRLGCSIVLLQTASQDTYQNQPSVKNKGMPPAHDGGNAAENHSLLYKIFHFPNIF